MNDFIEEELFYVVYPGVDLRDTLEKILAKRGAQQDVQAISVVPASAIRKFRRENTFVEVTDGE